MTTQYVPPGEAAFRTGLAHRAENMKAWYADESGLVNLGHLTSQPEVAPALPKAIKWEPLTAPTPDKAVHAAA